MIVFITQKRQNYSFLVPTTILTITDSGTASKIHKKPNSDAPTNIHKKITNGLTPSFCAMTAGTIILFSAVCITRYMIITPTIHFRPKDSHQTNNAGIAPSSGHT